MSVARRFESLFGRDRKDFTDDGEQPANGEPFDNSNEISAGNPSLDETQKELAGLRDKVRDVARQIGRAIICTAPPGANIEKSHGKIPDSPFPSTVSAAGVL